MEFAIALQIDAENPTIGDARLVNGQLVFTTTLADEVAIRLYSRFLFFKRSWFLDLRQGRALYYEKDVPEEVIRSEIAQTIEGTVGVLALTSLRIERGTNRDLTVVFEARLEDGTTFRSTSYPPFLIRGGT